MSLFRALRQHGAGSTLRITPRAEQLVSPILLASFNFCSGAGREGAKPTPGTCSPTDGTSENPGLASSAAHTQSEGLQAGSSRTETGSIGSSSSSGSTAGECSSSSDGGAGQQQQVAPPLERWTTLEDGQGTGPFLSPAFLWSLITEPFKEFQARIALRFMQIDPIDFLEGAQDAAWAVGKLLDSKDENDRKELQSMVTDKALQSYNAWREDVLREHGFRVSHGLDSVDGAELVDCFVLVHDRMTKVNPDLAGPDSALPGGDPSKVLWVVVSAAIKTTANLEFSKISKLCGGREIKWHVKDKRTQLWQFVSGPMHGPTLIRQQVKELEPWTVAGVATQLSREPQLSRP